MFICPSCKHQFETTKIAIYQNENGNVEIYTFLVVMEENGKPKIIGILDYTKDHAYDEAKEIIKTAQQRVEENWDEMLIECPSCGISSNPQYMK